MWPQIDEKEQYEPWHAYCTLERKCNNANDDDNDNAIVAIAVAAAIANADNANADDERNK